MLVRVRADDKSVGNIFSVSISHSENNRQKKKKTFKMSSGIYNGSEEIFCKIHVLIFGSGTFWSIHKLLVKCELSLEIYQVVYLYNKVFIFLWANNLKLKVKTEK